MYLVPSGRSPGPASQAPSFSLNGRPQGGPLARLGVVNTPGPFRPTQRAARLIAP